MSKLLSPVQYEDKLDGLNTVRPLSLKDEVKQSIEIPVLDVNPANQKGAGLGKLLRCTDNGVLIASNHNGFTNIQNVNLLTTIPPYKISFTFSQKVFGLWNRPSLVVNCTKAEFTDSTFTKAWHTIDLVNQEWVAFEGTSVYILVTASNGLMFNLSVQGFYN